MKNSMFLICLLLITTSSLKAQTPKDHYTVFNPNGMEKEFFMSANSGILKTPVGIKIGYICNPGLYLGLRFGKGSVYNSDSDLRTIPASLFSITAGITKPLIIDNDFKLVMQLGLGYGEWWDFRWERWTKSGIEGEGGIMLQKKRLLFSVTGNVLTGDRTYPTGDFCLGIGYVFENK